MATIVALVFEWVVSIFITLYFVVAAATCGLVVASYLISLISRIRR
ncbi:hypothetical protein ACFFIG_32175 [Paraburkholderia rhizosphaerae]